MKMRENLRELAMPVLAGALRIWRVLYVLLSPRNLDCLHQCPPQRRREAVLGALHEATRDCMAGQPQDDDAVRLSGQDAGPCPIHYHDKKLRAVVCRMLLGASQYLVHLKSHRSSTLHPGPQANTQDPVLAQGMRVSPGMQHACQNAAISHLVRVYQCGVPLLVLPAECALPCCSEL